MTYPKKDVWAFIEGDEVYNIDSQEVYGKVIGIGTVNIKVRAYKDNKIKFIKPSKLYCGFDWHNYNPLVQTF
jgi:hypothetical protein